MKYASWRGKDTAVGAAQIAERPGIAIAAVIFASINCSLDVGQTVLPQNLELSAALVQYMIV
jgi:hypothetical protein